MTTTGAAGFDLRDETTFLRLVKVPRAATGLAGTFLALAIGAALWNLASTLRTDGSMRSLETFWAVFTSTNGTDDVTSIWLYVLVWGPIVLIPLCLLSLIWDGATHRSVQRRAHRQFVEAGGYVARQVPIGATFSLDRRRSPVLDVVLLLHPGLDVESTNRLIRDARAHLEHTTVKQLDKALRAGQVMKGMPLATIFPPAPPELVITTQRKAEAVVVLPALGKRRAQVLDLKG